MELVKCSTCLNYFEEEDVQLVERKTFCYQCIRHCNHCDKPFDFPSESVYCYDCLECNLV